VVVIEQDTFEYIDIYDGQYNIIDPVELIALVGVNDIL
jgi:hypothetical protein